MKNNIDEYFEYSYNKNNLDFVCEPDETYESKAKYKRKQIKTENDIVLPSNHTKLITRKEAAEYIGMSPGTLAVWASTKRYDLKPIKVGTKAVRYLPSELDKFLLLKKKP